MKIQNSQMDDLAKVVYCHRKAFPFSLSSQLGSWFCQKMMSWYIVSDRGVMIHALENEKILGYIGAIIIKKPGMPGASTSVTQYSFWPFVISFLNRPWLLFHSENRNRIFFIFKNIAIKLRLLKNKKNLIGNTEFRPSWGLVVIGVNPVAHGMGVGSALIKRFEELARLDGVAFISLSVKNDNLKAISFYTRNGWCFDKQDGDSQIMIKKITN